LGLLPDELYERFCAKRAEIRREKERLEGERLVPGEEINRALVSLGSSPLEHPVTLAELLRRPEISYRDVAGLVPPPVPLSPEAAEEVEVEIKYAGYIAKEEQLVRQMERLERRQLPEDLDYENIRALSNEAREKLTRIRPRTLGQAARIPGVSPADISVLLIYLKGRGRGQE
jgi:tRNA uridine 5-carboxymethylaminomethyl modification enzyme